VQQLVEYKERGERPDTKTLEAALVATANGFSSAHIIIDGLDECSSLTGDRERLLKSILRILTAASPNLHIFCTSRNESDIDAAIRPLLSATRVVMDLEMHRACFDADLSLYIDSMLASPQYRSWPEEMKNEARETMVKNADGMWVFFFFFASSLR